MIEDRSAAFCDTTKQAAIAPKSVPVARWGMRRWVMFSQCALCLTVFTVLLLIYALAPLPEWLSLLIGVAIVLVFAGMIAGIGVATHAPSDWE